MAPAQICALVDALTGEELAARVEVARSPLRRMRGLLGRAGLAPGEGVWLEPVFSIHTWFMRFSIDVLFLDEEQRVLRVVPSLRPFRFAVARGARSVVELPAGTLAHAAVATGQRLSLRAATTEAAA